MDPYFSAEDMPFKKYPVKSNKELRQSEVILSCHVNSWRKENVKRSFEHFSLPNRPLLRTKKFSFKNVLDVLYTSFILLFCIVTISVLDLKPTRGKVAMTVMLMAPCRFGLSPATWIDGFVPWGFPLIILPERIFTVLLLKDVFTLLESHFGGYHILQTLKTRWQAASFSEVPTPKTLGLVSSCI